jgi:hypothetical protein
MGRRRFRPAVIGAAVLVLAAIVIAALVSQSASPTGNQAQPTTATTAGATKSTLPATTSATAAGSVTPNTAPANLIGSLLTLASRLGPNDGSGYRQLVTGLDRIASLPAIAQPGAATALLAQATNWYKDGQLSDAAYSQAVALLTPLSAQPLTPPTDPGKVKGGKGGD